jgi:hypothetical protein
VRLAEKRRDVKDFEGGKSFSVNGLPYKVRLVMVTDIHGGRVNALLIQVSTHIYIP